MGRELSIGIQHFFDTKSQFFQNSFSPEGEEWKRGVVDTWYAFNNLYQVIRVTLETREPKLVNSSLSAVERIIKFVHACHYEIPLFAKIAPAIKAGSASDGTIIGYALNPSVLGIYAALLIKSAELFPEKSTRYQEEALESLGRLHRWPLSQLFHEPVQLALAASAAHALGQKTLRDDFTRCLLLCCYRDGPNVGLFQGCAGQRYPAFRETVEAVQHLIEWMDEDPRSVPLRDIVTLSMCNTPKFLETTGDSKSLPKEGLQSIEQEKAAEIGVAIYAAPGIFELARIQVLGNIR